VNISPLDIRKQTFRTVFWRTMKRSASSSTCRFRAGAPDQQNGQLNERVCHCDDRLAGTRSLIRPRNPS
jgi:hypothetical protein